jgi:hypothetical protein
MTLQSEFVEDVRAEKAAVRAGESEDLDRLAERKGAMNQGLGVHQFAFNDAGSTYEDAKLFRRIVSGDGYDLPLTDVREVAADTFAGRVSGFRRYHLDNAADLLERLAEVVVEVDDSDDFDELIKETYEYMIHLQYRIATRLPFHELGVVFEGYKLVEEDYLTFADDAAGTGE